MSVQAKVIADSISSEGVRLTSLQVTLHRFVLSEMNTHRVFSRSYRSSRAVPVKKLLEEVRTSPAMPLYWGANKPGMQAPEELTGTARGDAEFLWRGAAQEAAAVAERLAEVGLHKQIANRVLEPFLYTHGIITSTEWENFFRLRLDPAAQPEMRAIATEMHEAISAGTPRPLKIGEWHLPYIGDDLFESAAESASSSGDVASWNLLRKISAARCARVSYKVFDADRPPMMYEDLDLAERLLKSGHWGPFEHQATPDEQRDRAWAGDTSRNWSYPELHGNFRGWIQQRKVLEQDCAI